MSHAYCILDVFTNVALSGNPLAVVFDADDLSAAAMQAIAREFNLSETVFICAPREESNSARLRIFTVTSELPFAGHPTVGASVALGLRDGGGALRLEEQVGLVRAEVILHSEKSGRAQFGLPQLSVRAGDPPAVSIVAEALGILPEEIGFGRFEIATYSAGLEFICVPVRDQNVQRKLTPDFGNWTKNFGVGHNNIFSYTPVSGEYIADYSARMFAPDIGCGEDPATGSAVAAFSGALGQFGDLGTGEHCLKILQGIDMGRPSEIDLRLIVETGNISAAEIGGDAIVVARGMLDVGN